MIPRDEEVRVKREESLDSRENRGRATRFLRHCVAELASVTHTPLLIT